MSKPSPRDEDTDRVHAILRADRDRFRARVERPSADAPPDVRDADRRAYVRALFAHLDAAVDRHRRRLLDLADAGRIDLALDEQVVLREVRYDVGRNGAIEPYRRPLSFTRKLRAVFRIAGRAFDRPFEDAFARNEWRDFRRAVRVRDRVTHPKSAADCRVTDAEIGLMAACEQWYDRLDGEFVAADIAHR